MKDENESLKKELNILKARVSRIERFLLSFNFEEDNFGFNEVGEDELLIEAVKEIQKYRRASASLIQRTLSVGYARAVRILDQIEEKGLVTPSDGTSKPREVNIENVKDFLNEYDEKIE